MQIYVHVYIYIQLHMQMQDYTWLIMALKFTSSSLQLVIRTLAQAQLVRGGEIRTALQ